MSVILTKTRIAIVATIAFIGGVTFASGMDWTKIVSAQSRGSLGKPISNVSTSVIDQQNSFVAVAEHVTPAVVSIDAQTDPRRATPSRSRGNLPPGFEQFFGDPQNQGPTESTGSGFIVSSDGYILTNNHVVEGADRVTVSLTDRRSFKARIIGADRQTDVAVLKIEGSNFPTAALGDDNKVRIGEWATPTANPWGLDFTGTARIISAKGRADDRMRRLSGDSLVIQDFLQTDAAINPGNSGGPLVNIRGEVIGINAAIASQTGTYAGYGFAIPITLAKTVMDDIVAHGRVRRAIMGVRIGEVTAEDAAINGLKTIAGVKIGSFEEGSNADKAGFEQGDIILKIDGKPVDRVSTLQRLVRSHQPGDVIELEGVRYGKKQTYKIKLIEAEPEKAAVASATRDDRPAGGASSVSVKKLGLTIAAPPAALVRASGELAGAFVTGAERGGPAYNSMGPGDLIVEMRHPDKTAIKNVADLQKAVAKLKEGDYVSFLVKAYDFQSTGELVGSRIVNLRVGGN